MINYGEMRKNRYPDFEGKNIIFLILKNNYFSSGIIIHAII